MKIRLAKPAERDLEEVEAYISLDNPRAALQTVTRVLEAMNICCNFLIWAEWDVLPTLEN